MAGKRATTSVLTVENGVAEFWARVVTEKRSMGQRGVVLSAVARVLNAAGSRLVDVYDAMESLKAGGLPRGEKGTLKARLRECEKRLERVYVDIGRDVALHEPTGQSSAAREAAIERAAEYRAERATLTKRLQDIEREQQAARDAAALVTPRIRAEKDTRTFVMADAETRADETDTSSER